MLTVCLLCTRRYNVVSLYNNIKNYLDDKKSLSVRIDAFHQIKLTKLYFEIFI